MNALPRNRGASPLERFTHAANPPPARESGQPHRCGRGGRTAVFGAQGACRKRDRRRRHADRGEAGRRRTDQSRGDRRRLRDEPRRNGVGARTARDIEAAGRGDRTGRDTGVSRRGAAEHRQRGPVHDREPSGRGRAGLETGGRSRRNCRRRPRRATARHAGAGRKPVRQDPRAAQVPAHGAERIRRLQGRGRAACHGAARRGDQL